MPDIAPELVYKWNDLPVKEGPVVYWMSRDQRISDNPALLFAQDIALETRSPLVILFCLAPAFLGATLRQYDFMLRGLRGLESASTKLNIPLVVRPGNPAEEAVAFATEVRAGAVVTDFSPLKIHRLWKKEAGRKLEVSFAEVDAHNVVPCRVASDQQEYSARTIRPKIHRLLARFLQKYPDPVLHPYGSSVGVTTVHWESLVNALEVDRSVLPVRGIIPGEHHGHHALRRFIQEGLARYSDEKNDPNKKAVSGLSPYLHFGQISARQVALAARAAGGESAEVFLEELIVRKELAENFCFYNDRYDTFSGLPAWGQTSLRKHWNDGREFAYSTDDFEKARTHDPLWNAAQTEMVTTGCMHGYMRMYWAKKILEWSSTPEEAYAIALYLNDKYELDGRDPNGYAGIAWSLGGLHDRPWPERPVFGTIRYMNASGCRRKFDTDRYIAKFGT